MKAIDKNNDYSWDVEAIKTINHNKIVKVLDVQETEKYVYLIKEYISGVTLEEYVNKKGPLPEEEVIAKGLELCEILNYFHSLVPTPLIYRDLKPANILISEDGSIKLIDLDSIRQYKQDSLKDTYYVGTEGFASPEQFGFSQTDMRTDIYALGATLYFLLTGEKPVSNNFKIKSVKSNNSQISEMMNDIIEKCTRFNPADRYKNIDELKKELICLTRNDSISRAKRSYSKLFRKQRNKILFTTLTIIVAFICYRALIILPKSELAYGSSNVKSNANVQKPASKSTKFSFDKTTINEVFWSGTMPKKQPQEFANYYKNQPDNIYNPNLFMISIVEWDKTRDSSQMNERIEKFSGELILRAKGYKDVQFVITQNSMTDGEKAHVYEARLYNNDDMVNGVKYKIIDSSGHWVANNDVYVVRPVIKDSKGRIIPDDNKFSYDKTTINEAFWAGSLPKKLPQSFVNYFIQNPDNKFNSDEFFISIVEWDKTKDYPQMRERIREVGGNLILRAKGYKDVPFTITGNSITVQNAGQVYYAYISDDSRMVSGVKYKIVDPSGHWLSLNDVFIIRPVVN